MSCEMTDMAADATYEKLRSSAQTSSLKRIAPAEMPTGASTTQLDATHARRDLQQPNAATHPSIVLHVRMHVAEDVSRMEIEWAVSSESAGWRRRRVASVGASAC